MTDDAKGRIRALRNPVPGSADGKMLSPQEKVDLLNRPYSPGAIARALKICSACPASDLFSRSSGN